MVIQPAGITAPKNSEPTLGANVTSPSAVWEILVLPSRVPALKSATVVSVKLTVCGTTMLHAKVAGVPVLPAASVA